MYESFYRFSGDPFRLLPDPEVCLLQGSCAHAWSYLQYAVKRGEGIVVVSGVPGSGKTNGAQTVGVRLVAHRAAPSVVLRSLAHAFGLEIDPLDDAQLEFGLERYLIDLAHSNRRALVVVDEAHTLSSESLEVLRLLADLQSHSMPVMQLFLLGDEELAMMLSAPRMAQIQQRVIASCRLHPMSPSETRAYLEYRLERVHWHGIPAIDGPAVAAIHRHSGGLPRQVNKICSRLFLYASAEEKQALGEADVQAVVEDFRSELLEVFTGTVEESTPDRRPDAADVRRLALVPPKSSEASRSLGFEPAGSDTVGRAVAAQPGGRSQHRAPRQPPAVAARPRNERVPQATGPRSPRPGTQWRAIASLRRNPFGDAPLMSAARSLGVAVTRRARSMSAVARQSAATIQARAKQALGDRSSELGRSARHSLVLTGRRLRAFALMRPSVKPRQAMLGLRQLFSGQRGALVAVAGIGLLSVAITLMLQGPKPRLDEAPPDFAQPSAEPPTGVAGTAALGAPTAPAVDPDPAQRQTPPIPGDRPTAGDDGPVAASGGATGFPGVPAAPLEAQSQAPHTVDRSPHVTPGAEAVASAIDDDVIETIGLPVSEPEEAAGIGPAPGGDASADLLAKGDPSTLLPAPAAGQPGSPGVAAYPVSERASVEPLPMPPSDLVWDEAVPESGPDDVTSRQPSGQRNDAHDPAPESAPRPGGTVESLADRSDEITLWLDRANAALQRDRLLFPESDSAVSYFRRVLEHDPKHSEAIAGMERVVDRYLVLAGSAFDRGELERADRLVSRALRVSPNHTDSLALRSQIADTRAEQQAEAERQRQADAARRAAEAAARAEAAELAAAAEAAREAELARQRNSLDWLLWRN